MMDENVTPREIAIEYRGATVELNKYIGWLEKKSGTSLVTTFEGQDISKHSMAFPVFDSTLLAFVKAAERSPLMNRNYRYDFTRNHIKTQQDELNFIDRADIHSLKVLGSILSKYILEGRVKPRYWNEGLESGIYLRVLLKIAEVAQFWDPIV